MEEEFKLIMKEGEQPKIGFQEDLEVVRAKLDQIRIWTQF